MAGDQFIAKQQQMMLHHKWNTTTYCIIPVKVGNITFQWGIMSNISLEVQALQHQVMESFIGPFLKVLSKDLLMAFLKHLRT